MTTRAPDGWLDEIDLDRSGTWLKMGLRRLGDEPWLIVDGRRDDELALRARLLDQRRDEVLADVDDPAGRVAATEVLDLVSAQIEGLIHVPLGSAAPERAGRKPADGSALERAGRKPADGSALERAGRKPADGSALERAGRMAQEDLCLLRRNSQGWVLAAAVLCFPSRWRLADKLGRPITEVHEPVPGYADRLARRVDTALDRLSDSRLGRRNWFLHPDASLFQPDRPPAGDPVIPAARCADELIVRSEWQTLRRLPESGWVLFTIRIQYEPLGSLLAEDGRRERFVRYLEAAPIEQLRHRGIAVEQAAELETLLNPGRI